MEVAGDRYFTDTAVFFFVLVVVHVGEKRTGILVPGKPEEVYSLRIESFGKEVEG